MPLFARRSRRARLVKVCWVALGQLLSYVGTSGASSGHIATSSIGLSYSAI